MILSRIFLVMVVMTCCTIAKAQSASDLIGKWVVDSDKTLNAIDGQEKETYTAMDVPAKDQMKRSLASRKFLFEKNNLVSIDFAVRETSQRLQGKWYYDNKTKTLKINTGKEAKEYIVQWENKNRVQLIYKNISSGALLKSLYITRTY